MSTARQKKVRSDLNIQLLVKREAKFKKAYEAAQEQFRAEAKAAWETKHITSSGSERERRLKETCEHELAMENLALLRHRRKNMEKLYEEESQRWEQELASKGLAIAFD